MEFQIELPLAFLIVIYKSFIRPYLDCVDIIYDQFFDFVFFFFHQKLESTQYNAALALTHEIRGTFRENLYQD